MQVRLFEVNHVDVGTHTGGKQTTVVKAIGLSHCGSLQAHVSFQLEAWAATSVTEPIRHPPIASRFSDCVHFLTARLTITTLWPGFLTPELLRPPIRSW